jgi:hypothetical protein
LKKYFSPKLKIKFFGNLFHPLPPEPLPTWDTEAFFCIFEGGKHFSGEKNPKCFLGEKSFYMKNIFL